LSKILIRNAFKNKTHALIFIISLFLSLMMPFYISFFNIDNKDAFIEAGTENGNFKLIHNIFTNKKEYEIVFLGSSLLWTSVNPKIITDHINKNLKTKIKGITLAGNWRGEDMLYRLWHGFLKHKQPPKLLIMTMPRYRDRQSKPHARSHVWWDYNYLRNFQDKMDRKTFLSYFASLVLGSPRKILSIIRKNSLSKRVKYSLVMQDHKVKLIKSNPYVFPDDHNGKLSVSQGFLGAKFKDLGNLSPILPPHKDLILSDKTRSKFKNHNYPLTSLQDTFLKEIMFLAKKNKVKVLILNVPIYSFLSKEKIPMKLNWKDYFGKNIDVIGAQKNILYKDFDDDKIKLFYYDDHLNSNGMSFWSKFIAPSILEIYKSTIRSN